MAFAWTEERVARAKEMAELGHSGGDIASELGISRSAVMGEMWRLGIRLKGVSPRFDSVTSIEAQRKRWSTVDHAESERRRAARQAELGRVQAEKQQRQAARVLKIIQTRQEWKEDPMPIHVECSPRPWTERKFGECAFPVEGEGADMKSCCNPVYREGNYCRGHSRVMFTPTMKREVKIPRGGLDFRDVRRERDRDVEAELFFAA